MSSLDVDTGIAYEVLPEEEETLERKAEFLTLKLFLCPDQFTMSDLFELAELFREMGLLVDEPGVEVVGG